MAIKQKEVNGIGSIIASVKSWAQGLFSTLGHKHAQEDITNFFHEHKALNVKVADKDDSDTPAGVKENINTSASVQAHVNTIYGQTADLYANKANKSHTHKREQITNFSHTHTKSEITDFSHTHMKSEITDFSHNHTKNDITDFPDISTKIGFPNYSSSTTKQFTSPTTNTFTATSDGYVSIIGNASDAGYMYIYVKIGINGIKALVYGGYNNHSWYPSHALIPVKAGDIVECTITGGFDLSGKFIFFPLR